MAAWIPFPHPGAFGYTAARLRERWPLLHVGDGEPWPQDAAAQQAWVHYHNGDFEQAVATAQHAALLQPLPQPGAASAARAAIRALCTHATHLQADAQHRLSQLQEAVRWAEQLLQRQPEEPNGHYLLARALGLYSQHISVGRALAEGLGTRVRRALARTFALARHHAQAHLAMAAFHAEVIDKLGVLIGGLTYGAKKEAGLHHYRMALALDPHAVTTVLEYAHGLRMLEGERARAEVQALLAHAQRMPTLDAAQRLALDAATASLT